MTKEQVLRDGIAEALRQIGELSEHYADDSVSEHLRHLNAHLTGTLMEADSAGEPGAELVGGKAGTAGEWLTIDGKPFRCAHLGESSEWETETMIGRLCHQCGQNFNISHLPSPENRG